MGRPEISPLHERYRRRAFGLEKRNEMLDQSRILGALEELDRPKRRRFRQWVPSPERIAWQARMLAELYIVGSGDPVRGVFNHREISAGAMLSLKELTDPAARHAVWQVWLQDPGGGLKELIKEWLPADPRDKAVTFFLLGDQDAYAHADPSGELVESARREGDPVLRVHLAAAARRGEHVPWAYRVAAVPEHLLPEEWEAVIALLRTDRQQYLWDVLAKAPLEWSARCLTELGDWDAPDPTLVRLAKQYARTPHQPFEADPAKAQGPAISPDGTMTARARRSGAVRLRRLKPRAKTLAYLPTRAAGIRKIHTLLFSPTGDLLLAGGWDRDHKSRLVVAQVPSGEPIALLPMDDPQTAPVFTPDGTYLVIHEQGRPAVWRLPACTRVDTPLQQLLPTADNAALRAELDAYLRRDRPRDL